MHDAFITSPDRSPVQDGFSGEDLKHRWVNVNQALFLSFDKLSPSHWLEKHTADPTKLSNANHLAIDSRFCYVEQATFLITSATW